VSADVGAASRGGSVLAPTDLLASLPGEGARRAVDMAMRTICLGAAVLCVIPLAALVAFVVANGLPAVDISFLVTEPQGIGSGGAVAAIAGTFQLVPLATLWSAPIGVLGGVYLAEFGDARAASAIRFAADVLVGLPSVVVGVFVFAILVAPFGQYNAFAGSIALAIIMVPIILRNTEEILRLVPGSLREASLALGVPMWRTIVSVIIPTGLGGILTGVMLAVARAAGETAPLILTSLGSRLLNVGDLGAPMDALPLYVYVHSGQPDPVNVGKAWGAAFLLLVFVLAVNILVRFRTVGRKAQ
jgi:phosphate transport system permease protein